MGLEAKNSKVKDPADLVSHESQVPGSRVADFSLCPHMAKGVRELSGVSFIRTLITFMRVPSL